MLTVVAQEGSEKQQEPVSLLDQLVRDGARQMLAAALRAEVADYIEQFADVRDDTGIAWWSATGTTMSGRW